MLATKTWEVIHKESYYTLIYSATGATTTSGTSESGCSNRVFSVAIINNEESDYKENTFN